LKELELEIGFSPSLPSRFFDSETKAKIDKKNAVAHGNTREGKTV